MLAMRDEPPGRLRWIYATSSSAVSASAEVLLTVEMLGTSFQWV